MLFDLALVSARSFDLVLCQPQISRFDKSRFWSKSGPLWFEKHVLRAEKHILLEPEWFTFGTESGQVEMVAFMLDRNNEMMAMLVTETEAKTDAQIVSLLITVTKT